MIGMMAAGFANTRVTLSFQWPEVAHRIINTPMMMLKTAVFNETAKHALMASQGRML